MKVYRNEVIILKKLNTENAHSLLAAGGDFVPGNIINPQCFSVASGSLALGSLLTD